MLYLLISYSISMEFVSPLKLVASVEKENENVERERVGDLKQKLE